ISQLAQCGQLGELPELPAPDEQRLQKAALLLQQRLVLRQWLTKYTLQSYYPKLLSLEVASLEDVYWLEDNKAKQVFNKDFSRWSAARQSLPISKQRLETLKADLWSEVVKNSNHQDAWTWGKCSNFPYTAILRMRQKLNFVSKCRYHYGSEIKFWDAAADEKDHYQGGFIISDYVAVSSIKVLAVITELGSPTDPNSANVAKVKFTVRHAGQYRISVMVGNQHVAGSPFMTLFVAGPAYAQRTIVDLLNLTQRRKSPFCYYIEEENFNTNLDYDWESQRVSVQLKFVREGCYHATIYYHGTELHNGDFDIIVLNSIDSTLVSMENECRKRKKVLCYVSPKQLIIKELILKFIPKRLFTFRLCPSTKFNFKSESLKLGDSYSNSFTIDDGCQPKVELVSKERNVIAATFAQFLLKNMGGSETFKDKQDFFYHEVRKFHQKHYHEKLSMKVNREKLLESSMKATKNFSVSDWCRNFEVTFQGEQGIDWGGLRREWFELICAQLFDAKYGLFTSFHEGQQSLVHPNPQRPQHLKLRHYEFAGKVVGKCLYESALGGSYRQLVRARFTRSFLAQVIGLRVHYKYLLENNIDEIETELYFVEEQYDSVGQLIKNVELIPSGSKIKVMNCTKLQYLDNLAQYKLATSIKDEMEAFLKGLNELIPDNLLSIFDENELELLLCGTGQYSIADFKAHHVVNGNSAEFRRIVGWFWAAVGNFTQEEMARLLQFTTGCSQLPPGGFKELTPRFQITAAPTFGNLPTAHTCFNQLCLPDYDCYEHFEKSLLLAISEGTEGFGMV
ncbi:hypothetical protein NQ314_004549, partial [Rhamnusium bicolor]